MKSLFAKSATPRAIIAIAISVVVLFMGIVVASRANAAGTASAGQRLITIHDRGEDRGILTRATTLRDAFNEADIHIDPSDIVEPGMDDPLVASSYDVNIYRARPVTIVDGATKYKVMSSYQTPKQITEQAGIELQREDITSIKANTDMVSEGSGLRLSIDRATPFTLLLYGTKTPAYTQETTVAAMLKTKKITIGSDDTLNVPLETVIQPGMTIELWRNGKQTAAEEQPVAFETEKIQDADQPVGYKLVKTPGVAGKKTVTFEIEMKNGQEVARKEIQSLVTLEPKKQIEIVGAKFNYTGGPLSEVQINALGQCESGMTATRNSGNGFYGAFQFTASTWRSYNKTYAYAHEAPLDVQKQAVQDLLSKSSIFTQFPGCAKKMRDKGII